MAEVQQGIQPPQSTDGAPAERTVEQAVDRALRHMRLLAAAVLAVQGVLAPATNQSASHLALVVAAPFAVALALNGLAVLVGGLGPTPFARRVALLEHVADVLVVVAVVGLSGRGDVVWALLVVPVLAGALRHRLRGAVLTWAGVAVLHMANVGAASGLDEVATLVSLQEAVTQLAVVLLVALPAGYLSEHLLLEVRGLSRVYASAERRGELLEVVAASGREVTRLDRQVVDAALSAAPALGYVVADLWEERSLEWHRLGALATTTAVLPTLDPDGAEEASVGAPTVVDRRSGTPEEIAGLDESGLEAYVLVPVPGRVRRTLLRAGVARGEALHPAQVECLQLLCAQAEVAIRNAQLLVQLRDTKQALEHQAFHDPLTGLANRALFLRRLEAAAQRARTDGTPFAVLYCDLDRFKAINDTLGHEVGDELLKAAVGRLSRCLRSEALLARIGGDEFIVLLPTTSGLGEAEAVARRMCEVLTAPFGLAGHEVTVGTSIGIVLGDRDCTDAVELMRRADVAMYRSKARGRACWTAWSPELDVTSAWRLSLESDLRRAVADDTLDLDFQPIVRSDGTVAGAEALVRWHSPQHGPVAPEVFLPLAEESALIVDLGHRVLARAVQVAATWLAVAPYDCFVSVNVSARQLLAEGFAAEVQRLAAGAGLPPHRLMLEISERDAAQDGEAARVMEQLRGYGFRLALDDFGQGQTSLQQLRRLPLTMLKVDRAFVEQAVTDHRARLILRSVTGLGRDLGLLVVAEGVESDPQRAVLNEVGCTHQQGFALAAPGPAGALPPFPSSVPSAPMIHPAHVLPAPRPALRAVPDVEVS